MLTWLKKKFSSSDNENPKIQKMNIDELTIYNSKKRKSLLESYRPASNPFQFTQVPLHGLQNPGNKCYMNSALLCLMHVVELNEFVLRGAYFDQINTVNKSCRGNMILEYYQLLYSALCTKEGSSSNLNPSGIRKAAKIATSTFEGAYQQDSQEFLSFLLDALHEDLNLVLRKHYVKSEDYDGEEVSVFSNQSWEANLRRDNSKIVDLFFGQFQTKTVCGVCEHVSLTMDPFNVLSLDIPKKIMISGSFVPFFSKDPIRNFKVLIDENSSVAEAADFVKTQLKISENSLFEIRLKQNSKIVRNAGDFSSIPVKNIANGGFVLSIDELCNSEVICDGLNREVIVNSLKGDSILSLRVSLSIYLGSILISTERDFIFSNNLSLFSLIRVLFYIHSESSIDSVAFQTLNQEIENKLLKLYPQKKFDGSKSPFWLVIDGNLIRDFSDPSHLSQKYIGNLPSIQIHINKSSPHQIQIHRVIETSIVNLNSVNFLESMKLFSKPEIFDRENLLFCTKCKKNQIAQRTTTIYHPPNIFIIHLKRFIRQPNGTYSKDPTHIIFPTDEFVFENSEPKKIKYELFGIINHMGDMSYGHNSAFCRQKGAEWKLFDDVFVFSARPEQVVTSSAYILFYRKVGIV